jgi:signal transduction histidine kinase
LEEIIKPQQPIVLLMLNQQRIGFAIRAILDNAIKFTPEGGIVTLEIKLEDDQLKLLISDTGIGISTSELTKIFNKFYQIDPEQTGQVRGFGLGLHYARDFISSMGGQLLIESQPEQGTLVTIQFPLPD